MTIPALLFALLVALLYGALYHFVRGGGFVRLLLFFILSMIGFAMGHLVGMWRGWVWMPVGSINLGPSSIGSLLILVFGDWLTRIEVREESKV
ncbi:MAG TPA: hypothetical protein VHO49_19285 [Anaerolineales bacterium]|nr:hypothetical protein [Anaerolineales bacterium]